MQPLCVPSHLNKFKFGKGLLFFTTILFNDDSELKKKNLNYNNTFYVSDSGCLGCEHE